MAQLGAGLALSMHPLDIQAGCGLSLPYPQHIQIGLRHVKALREFQLPRSLPYSPSPGRGSV